MSRDSADSEIMILDIVWHGYCHGTVSWEIWACRKHEIRIITQYSSAAVSFGTLDFRKTPHTPQPPFEREIYSCCGVLYEALIQICSKIAFMTLQLSPRPIQELKYGSSESYFTFRFRILKNRQYCTVVYRTCVAGFSSTNEQRKTSFYVDSRLCGLGTQFAELIFEYIYQLRSQTQSLREASTFWNFQCLLFSCFRC